MHDAALWGHIETLRAFVEAGVNLTNPEIAGPVLYEAQRGEHPEAVQYLLSVGAKASLEEIEYNPLVPAVTRGEADLESLSSFLREGVNPDTRIANGETALMFAAAFGHETAVAMLLQAGADPTIKGRLAANCHGVGS